MTLTAKQRREFKALGQKMGDDVTLGKGGLTESMAKHIHSIMARKGLIKLRFAEKLEGEERKLFATELAEALEAELVGLVGRTVLLYRPKEEQEAD